MYRLTLLLVQAQRNHGAPKVIKFLKEDTKKTLHSSMVVDVNPVALGERIVADMKKKRKTLGI